MPTGLQNLITKARLSLTHSLTLLSRVPKERLKHIHSAKIKGLVCISLQSLPNGRVVYALDCRSDEDVRAGSIPVTSNLFIFFFIFFLNDDGGASRSSASKYEVQSSRERSNRECECKAQSLREQSD